MQTTKADVLYAGADLHGNNVFLSVCDAGGIEVFRRRVKTDLDVVNTALNPYWPKIQQMGVESTFNWYWFVDGLRAQGRNVTLGNPAQMKQYSGLKSTDDRSDARWLAELVRLGIFPESYIYPEETRSVRDALRRRQLFVRRRTQVLLSLGSLLTRYGLDARRKGITAMDSTGDRIHRACAVRSAPVPDAARSGSTQRPAGQRDRKGGDGVRQAE